MTRVASLIPPINLDYRVSKRLNDKDRHEERVLAYMGLPLKERGGHAWLACLLR